MFNFDLLVERRNTNSMKWNFPSKSLPTYVTNAPLPLWVADMDFKSPPCVIEALQKAVEFGVFGYGEVAESNLTAIANWQKNHFNWNVQLDWIIQTPGVVTAINYAIQAFSHPGDDILIQTPVYAPFHSSPKSNGRHLVEVPFVEENGAYRFDINAFESAITEKTKLFILCNPHNPFGKVWEESELKAIGEVCLRHNILVISDEIHQDLIFNPQRKHTPFASIDDEFAKISITCTAPSKTFNVAGLQTSNLIIPNKRIRNEMRNALQRSGLPAPNILGQIACEAAYIHGEPWLNELKVYLQNNFSLINEKIEIIKGVKVFHTDALYLAWLDFRDTGLSGPELHQYLLTKANIWLDDGLKFGCNGNGFARLNFGCTQETLTLALDRLARAFN